MSWEQRLQVTGGKLAFKAINTTDRYIVQGLLTCSEPTLEDSKEFRVWFQDVDHFAPYVEAHGRTTFAVLGGDATVKPRLETDDSPPTDFFTLSRRLLYPQEEEGSRMLWLRILR